MKRLKIMQNMLNNEEIRRHVAEKFVSVNGEGQYAGLMAVFIRFAGCNLRCSYCDTAWALDDKKVGGEFLSDAEISEYIVKSNARHVTLTGGEPLLQNNIKHLINKIQENPDIIVEIESNGSIDIRHAMGVKYPERLVFTLDYKLPASGVEKAMLMSNYEYIRPWDCIKFVVSTEEDLKKTAKIIEKYDLQDKCNIFLSPVFGAIKPVRLAEFVLEKQYYNVHVQVQLHKILWDPNARGV